MKIITTFQHNTIPYIYGKGAILEDTILGYPVRSFPFEVIEIPEEAQYISFTLIDHDAVPLCGFSWIHWQVANIKVINNKVEIIDNLSMKTDQQLCQGQNSFASSFLTNRATEIHERYVGPMPPDKNHDYTLTVYATKKKMNLRQGFYFNELRHELKDNLIKQCSIELMGLK